MRLTLVYSIPIRSPHFAKAGHGSLPHLGDTEQWGRSGLRWLHSRNCDVSAPLPKGRSGLLLSAGSGSDLDDKQPDSARRDGPDLSPRLVAINVPVTNSLRR
jgi:hypothetical protein